ncbi:FecR family protein [Flavobacterium flavigenum]|uniref:FecR family protein n=1 Tax=Flavobacterium flavigenum TaxID=3003258 RepID=UPI0022AC7C75|nr:FecR family protein [Flavobacterium flavigenum]
MKDIFNLSILIIKKKLKILSDDEKSRLKYFKQDYPFSKDIDFVKIVSKISNYSLIDKEAAWKSIVEKSNNKKVIAPVISINRSWLKYAAAGSLVLLLSLSYWFLNKADQAKNNVLANTPIEIGSSKATLTLEDGSRIALGKGTNYNRNNLSSNGEHIIYKSQGKEASQEIGSNFLTIPRGGQFFIELADQTKVWLNSESQLKYPVAFIDGEVRKVELVYGEAYFEVSPSSEHKGSKFEVFTKKQTVEVMGTQFNIKAYNGENNIYTTLVEGKVSVNIAGRKHLLIPKQQSDFDLTDNQIKIYTADVYSSVAWKEGLFSFNNMSLKDIMKVLSRWYNVDVTFENTKLENVKFNGVLRKDQDLKEILTTIQTTKFINAYEIKNRRIIIK